MPPVPDGSRARLAWRCRRGMKELDLLLLGWFQAQFEGAAEAERAQFESLLELPDPLLARYLLAGEQPEQPERAAVVRAVMTRSRIMLPAGPSGNLPPVGRL